MKTRNKIIKQAKKQLSEIRQYFTDVEHWNSTRGPAEGRIDPDPDGSMMKTQSDLENMLSRLT